MIRRIVKAFKILFGIKKRKVKNEIQKDVVVKETKRRRTTHRAIRRFLKENKDLWNDLDKLTEKAISTGVYSTNTKFNIVRISLYRRLHGKG